MTTPSQKLKVATGAEDHYLNINKEYSQKILAAADIMARSREGTEIDIGDLNKAREKVENRSGLTTYLAMFASALIGAGISNGVQNTLEGKYGIYAIVFGGFLVVGILIAWFIYRRS